MYLWMGSFAPLISWLADLHSWLVLPVYLIAATIFCVMFIPMGQVIFSKIQYPILKIVACIALLVVLYSNLSFWRIPNYPNLTTFVTTGALGSIAFFITICFIVAGWGYALNPNIKLDSKLPYNFTILIILILYALIDSFWNGFGNGGNTVFDLFTHFNSFSMVHLTFNTFAQAIESGLLEETMRYVIVIILLEWLAQKQHKVSWTIIISSLLFALAHMSNALSGQNLVSTFVQVGLAFSSGVFYCVLFLYSGKLWLVILLHGVYDYLVFIQPGESGSMDWTGGISGLIVFLIKFILPLAFSALVLLNNQYKIININANKLVSDK